MLTFTDTAKERVNHFLEAQRAQGVSAIRVAGSLAEPKLWLVKETDAQASDHRFDGGGFEVIIDAVSAGQLEGAVVDFVSDVMQSGFRVYYPSPTWDDPVAQRVQEVIDQQINPGVASHGGRVELAGVESGTAYITMQGGCQGCGQANVTLRQGIEVMIKEAVPEVKRIEDATDHAGGENPYYAAEGAPGESPLSK